jgi:hypothetical protein
MSGSSQSRGEVVKEMLVCGFLGCTECWLPWDWKAFGDLASEKSNTITAENQICPFCLLQKTCEK